MSNVLTPGFAGLVAPKPGDETANPPGPAAAANPISGPPPGPSDMQQHFMSQEDAEGEKFKKLKSAKKKMDLTLKQFDKLSALGDTVSMEDVMEAASNMVAAGIPTISIASMLAEAPEQPSQLQAWVGEQIQKIAPKAAQLDQIYSQAGYSLGLSALKSIMSHSAEEHFSKRALAAMPTQGRA